MKEQKDLNEKVYFAQIDCGLKVYVLPKAGYANKYSVIASDFGSIDNRYLIEDKNQEVILPDGIAHFLEHKLFEEEFGSIEDKFAELGAYNNAFTNHTITGYLFSCVDNFDESLDVLLSFVSRPYFTDQNVEKEKGIIAQEIKMYDDDPEWRSFSNFLDAMYHEFPVKIDIAGSVDSIYKINKEILYECYNTFYHPTNMTLFIVGDLDAESTIDLANSIMNKLSFPKANKIKRIRPCEPETVRIGYATQQMEVSEPLLYVGYKVPDTKFLTGDLLKNIVIGEMLSNIIAGNSSDFYQQLYRDGLIDKAFGAFLELEEEYGFFAFSGKTKDPKALVERIISGVEDFLKKEDDTETLERIRKDMIGSFVTSFNSLEYIAYNFIAYELNNISILDRLKATKEVTWEEIKEFAKLLFKEDRRVVSVIEPKK